MSLTFGVSFSLQEAHERLVRRLRGDPSFVKKWSGGQFFYLRTDQGVHVPEIGSDKKISFYEL